MDKIEEIERQRDYVLRTVEERGIRLQSLLVVSKFRNLFKREQRFPLRPPA